MVFYYVRSVLYGLDNRVVICPHDCNCILVAHSFQKKKIQVFVFPIAHHLPFAAKSESLSLRLKKKARNVVVRTLKEGNLCHGGVEKVTGREEAEI